MTSFPILLAGTLAIGWWIGEQVEESVVRRIGSVTALYVDSFVAPHVQGLAANSELSPQALAMLEADLNGTELGKKIVALKIWRKDGYVLFDSDKSSMGRKFPIDEGLEDALRGNIFSEISERSGNEQVRHGQPLPRLIETYTPIHADRTGEIIAAAEFYERPDEVDREAKAAQWRSWLLVAACMLTIYWFLFLVVRRGSLTIAEQQSELNDKIEQLTELDRQNVQLHGRIVRAAERATALNENFLKRVSADIHDGPGQDLSFALMQMKNISEAGEDGADIEEDLRNLEKARLAVESALTDLRSMLSGIELPDIADMAVGDIAARVARDLQGKTGAEVHLDLQAAQVDAPFRVKVALYRLLQESLANTYRHAQCKDCRVTLTSDEKTLTVEISDKGPGFDPAAASAKGRLGMQGMRQRVEVLGGTFDLVTSPGAGTLIRVCFPLTLQSHEEHE